MNGKAPQNFLIDTGGGMLSLTTETAQRLGLRAVATSVTYPAGQTLVTLPDGTRPAGAIGTELVQRFLTTMDYAGKVLVLRQKTASQQRAFHREPAGSHRLPLWLGGDHIPCTLGSLNDDGSGIVTLDTGASSSASTPSLE
ncbi:hypothetical protein GCM10009804_29680 [Kribbella hippodromi]|uniref:Uncharacterized protein n=1 Tax=Kribbella hippodromi TaxID=434347 RepID=A0ABP4P495_9ACTN